MSCANRFVSKYSHLLGSLAYHYKIKGDRLRLNSVDTFYIPEPPENTPYLERVKSKMKRAFRYGTSEYFYRINTYARFLQKKYFFKDYITKPKYKIIDFSQEFQQELTFVLPFAYWHFLNGTLRKTISSKDTKELYFFSENHDEKYDRRVGRLLKESYGIPNMYHCKHVYYKKWTRVPLKEKYRNALFVYDKPLLIIANKYNSEWSRDPINYFSIEILEKVLDKLKHKYKIVYNRPGPDYIVMDNSEIYDLNESEHLKKNYPDVLLAEDLYLKFAEHFNNYNHFQLMLYANCDRFLSVHGGTAALASYFGGKNIILSKRGYEHVCGEFNNIFPALSGTEIYHAKEEEDVFRFLEMYY